MDEAEDIARIEPSVVLQIAVSFVEPALTTTQRERSVFDKKYVVFHATDPFTGVYLEAGRSKKYTAPARPQFTTEYFFNTRQSVKFQLYVKKEFRNPWGKHKETWLLATAESTLGELVRHGTEWLKLKVIGAPGYSVRVKANELVSQKEKAIFTCEAELKEIEDTPMSKAKLFFIFDRVNEEDRSKEEIYRSELVVGTLNPVWEPVSIPSKFFVDEEFKERWFLNVTLVNVTSIYAREEEADTKRVKKFRKEDYIKLGEATFLNFDKFKAEQGKKMTFWLQDPFKQGGKYNSGKFFLTMTLSSPPSFLDYIQKGLEMNFVVAIDFTANNGDPSHPSSLHRIGDALNNEYSSAIQAVGDIIQDYDTDKKFPVFGFGAKLPDGTISHDFHCTFDPENPIVDSVDGIIDVYQRALKKVTLAGPTLITPIINLIGKLAHVNRGGGHYFVLMILTSGHVTDLDEATRAIIEIAHLPISIVIVGIGNRDMSDLQQLGEKGRLLEIDGKYCLRDIVHFAKYQNPSVLPEVERAVIAKEFASEVMLEIPDHVMKYMEILKRPHNPTPTSRIVPQATDIEEEATGAGTEEMDLPPPPPSPPSILEEQKDDAGQEQKVTKAETEDEKEQEETQNEVPEVIDVAVYPKTNVRRRGY